MSRTCRRPVATPPRLRSLNVALPLLLLVLLGAGCGTFPLSMYVDQPVFDELARTSFAEEVDDEAIAAGLEEAFGDRGARVPLRSERYYRVDLAPGVPFRSREADDPAGAPLAGLRTGDLILAKNLKAQSLATTLAFEEFTYYSHLGLLVLEDDAAWVYEAWPRLNLKVITPDFISRFRGKVKRTPLDEFLERYETLLFLRLPDAERNARAVEAARRSIEEDIPYDPYHDPDRPGLSCSEYLEMLFVEEGGYPTAPPELPFGYNDSWRRISLSLGFHTDAYLVPDSFAEMPGARTVGMISMHRSCAEVRALVEAFVVLHDHDRPDSPAGDFLEAHPWRFLVYRPTTLAFLEWTKGWFRAHPRVSGEERRAVIETLFDLCFRPRDGDGVTCRRGSGASLRAASPPRCAPAAVGLAPRSG